MILSKILRIQILIKYTDLRKSNGSPVFVKDRASQPNICLLPILASESKGFEFYLLSRYIVGPTTTAL